MSLTSTWLSNIVVDLLLSSNPVTTPRIPDAEARETVIRMVRTTTMIERNIRLPVSLSRTLATIPQALLRAIGGLRIWHMTALGQTRRFDDSPINRHRRHR